VARFCLVGTMQFYVHGGLPAINTREDDYERPCTLTLSTFGKSTGSGLAVDVNELPAELQALLAHVLEGNIAGTNVEAEMSPIIDFIIETDVDCEEYRVLRAVLTEQVTRKEVAG